MDKDTTRMNQPNITSIKRKNNRLTDGTTSLNNRAKSLGLEHKNDTYL